jgi:hypothetical protein
MKDNMCTLLEIKKTHRAFKGNKMDFRFYQHHPNLMRVEGSPADVLACDFEVDGRTSKVFYINGHRYYVVWSPELENALGVPLSIFQDMQEETAKLRSDVGDRYKEICVLSKDLEATNNRLLDSYRVSIVFIALFVLSMLELTGILRQ